MKYLIAILLVVVGFGGGLFLGIGSALSDTEAMPRFFVPGDIEVELAAGDYTIYYESASVIDGVAIQNRETGSQVSCNVEGPNGPEGISFQAASVKTSYTLGSYSGESLFALSVPTDGIYYISCEKAGDEAAMAIGQSSLGSILFILMGVACLLAGMVMFIVALVGTFRSKSS